MRRTLSMLGFVWALPTTAIGLVLGLLTFQVPRVHDGVLVSTGAGLAASRGCSRRCIDRR